MPLFGKRVPLLALMSSNINKNRLNQNQFESLFKAHFEHLTNLANQLVNDRNTAKDITQKVFINLWENRSSIDLNKNIVSYLFTSVKNRSLNYIRDNKKFRSKVLDLDCGDFDLISPEDNFDTESLKSKIDDALNQLPEKCRKVFEMSRFNNMKYREIAEELEIAQKTVEAHMSKAIKSLRKSLKDDYLAIIILLGEII